MGSIHEVIEALRQERSNSERGTKFEKLMVRYFELHVPLPAFPRSA
jgi:predicted helicase